MNPIVTLANCFILLISWSTPAPVYAGELPGMVWVDGTARTLTIEQAGPPALWTAPMQTGDRVVVSGYVIITEQPVTVWITNTPVEVRCERVWMPMVVSKITGNQEDQGTYQPTYQPTEWRIRKWQ